ncbi:cytochrome P450 2F2-like [Parasteatoda tepidariorum]|uniref:cytochrome P450 2F2-like n=1 Tax=Parasteatoda tepidariorum TaxID=114398 RepID=UPI001C71842D|nr:cytochrome P450 2F2-like [Parasteatoda tepidariorum]
MHFYFLRGSRKLTLKECSVLYKIQFNMYILNSICEIYSVTNVLLLIAMSAILCFLASFYKIRRGKKLPPGPPMIPIFGSLPFLGSEPHKTLSKMRKKYGDIIGVYLGTKYTVVLNEFSVMKEVFSNSASLDKACEIFSHVPNFGLMKENGQIWQEQRKFFVSTISELGLGKAYWEEVVKEEVDCFLLYLKALEGKPTIISEALQFSISNNVISFLIGRKLDKEKEKDIIRLSVEFSRAVFEYTGTAKAAAVVPGLWKILQVFNIAGYDKAALMIRDFSEFMRSEILNHQNSNKYHDVRDFINLYLEKLTSLRKLGLDTYNYSELIIEGNALALHSGASDLIFASLDWLIRLMSEFKDVQTKVYEELTQVLGKSEKASYEERDKIPYTFAVILEGQRFSDSVTLISSRRAIRDIQIRGLTIPKGAEISANVWAMHNDPDYWEQPEKFMPERFLIDNGKKLIRNPPGFAVFSLGRRKCPGEIISLMEVLLYFTEIIRNFEVSLAPGLIHDKRVIRGLASILVPQPLCFKERKIIT